MKLRVSLLLLLMMVFNHAMASTPNAFYDYRIGNYQQAKKTIAKLSASGNSQAQFYYGIMHINGYAIPVNFSAGLNLILKSAERGYLPARLFIAKYYFQQDAAEEAMKWFAKSAAQGNIAASMYCAAALTYGYGVKRNLEKAKKHIIVAAKKGNATAQYNLALHFFSNKYKRDKPLALLWVKRAANQNHPDAQYLLAMLLYHGYHTKANQLLALQLLELSAKSGHTMAKEQLKKIEKTLSYGESSEKIEFSPKAIMENLTQVKEQSTPRKAVIDWLSQYNHATFADTYHPQMTSKSWGNQTIRKTGSYVSSPKMVTVIINDIMKQQATMLDPKTIPINYFMKFIGKKRYQEKEKSLYIPRYKLPSIKNAKATKDYLNSKALHGHADSQFLLGMMYAEGVGTEKDLNMAGYWYEQAAKQNLSKADYHLALMFLQGQGIEKNIDKALFWLNKAAFKGLAHAQYLLAALYEYGTDEIAKDMNKSIAMYNLSSANGFAIAKLNLADIYAAQLLSFDQTVAQQNKHVSQILEMYHQASQEGITKADLPLAYLLASSADKKNQHWAFHQIKQQADDKDPYAYLLLAIMYDRGIGTRENKSYAINWYQKSADAGNPIAKFMIGTYYYLGQIIRQDKEEGHRLIEAAAHHEVPFAHYNLAIIKNEKGLSAEYMASLKKAVQLNFSGAGLLLADSYMKNDTSKTEKNQAIHIYQRLAKLGYANAQLRLGFLYDHGIYLTKNSKQAKYWYEKSANQNNTIAQYQLAMLYYAEKPGSPNITQATNWLTKAARSAYVPAQIALGYIDEHDKAEYDKAKQWYTAAANNNNHLLAQFNLGLIYEYGKGEPTNYKLAYYWYSKSANQGYADAQKHLGDLFFHGFGVKADKKQAYKWYSKAAAQGHPQALHKLDLLSEAGI